MATLLQQKNCMKTLTNGGVSGGANANSSNSASGGGNVTTIQSSRILLPHEMVSITSSSNNTTICNNVGPSSTGALHMVESATQSMHALRQHQLPLIHQTHQYTLQNYNNTQFHNQNYSQNYNCNINLPFNNQAANFVYLTNTTTTPTTTGVTTISSINTTGPGTETTTAIIENNMNIDTQNSVSNTLNGTQLLTVMGTETVGVCGTNSITRNMIPILKDGAITNTVVDSHTNQPENYQHLNQYHKKMTGNVHEIKEEHNNDCRAKICESIDEPNKLQASTNGEEQPNDEDIEQTETESEIDIVINNVVCSFSVRCHLNLREIALNGFNVEFRREHAMVTMKLRRPYTTASIWSSGNITCTGATSEDQAKVAARRYARCLQKLGFRVRFHNFRIVNVLGTCSMPWEIKIVNFSEKYKKEASYEPELHPGVTYRICNPKATLKIFSTGSITVTAGSVAHVQAAIEHIYPLVYEFRTKRKSGDVEMPLSMNLSPGDLSDEDDELHSSCIKKKKTIGYANNDPTENIMYVSDNEDFEVSDDI